MIITLKYFGLIADFTKTNEQILQIEKSSFSTDELLKIVQSEYAELNTVNFTIAVNKNITNENIPLNDNDLVAFLPPFAGG